MNESLQFFHLNDDCLREVFSRLPSIESCAIKHTCNRFQTIANKVAKKRFKDIYECYPNDANLQHHTTILKSFGQFVLIMRLGCGPRRGSTGRCMQDDELLPLLKYCTSLVGLYLIGMNVQDLPIERVCHNLILLQFIECLSSDRRQRVYGDQRLDQSRSFASVLSACERLEVYGFLGGIPDPPNIVNPVSARLCNESSTIKHVTIDTICHNIHSHFPSPEDITHLFTLEFRSKSGRLATNIEILAETNAKLVNLVLNMPARTEDFRTIAKSLRIWTNLMSYDIITGFKLPNEICNLFSNLIYVGRSISPRKRAVVPWMFCRGYIHKYKWTRDTRLFQAESDEERRFCEFQEWKERIRKIGLHIDTM